MPADNEMTIDVRRKYLKKLQPRYLVADRAEKSRLLTEMALVTQLHRTSLVQLLKQHSRHVNRRSRYYGLAVEQAVAIVWESVDYLCAEQIQPALLPTAQHLARFDKLQLTPDLEAQLAQISVSTLQRLLDGSVDRPATYPRKGRNRRTGCARRSRCGASLGRRSSPDTARWIWSIMPGEAWGEYGHTLQLIDVATGWSERVAVLGRSQRAMEVGFRQILARLPCPIRELQPDNGSEFFNTHLVRFFGEAITGLILSRSGPYHKNDNRFVEQKNATLVRALLGHLRLETAEQVAQLNALYDQMWIYYNLFQPVLHLAEKRRVEGKLRRIWDQAQTPYQRLWATGVLDPTPAQQLARCYEQTNPRRLRQEICRQLAGLGESGLPQIEAA